MIYPFVTTLNLGGDDRIMENLILLFYESVEYDLRGFSVNLSHQLNSFCNSTLSMTPLPAVNTSVPDRFKRCTFIILFLYYLARFHVAQTLPG